MRGMISQFCMFASWNKHYTLLKRYPAACAHIQTTQTHQTGSWSLAGLPIAANRAPYTTNIPSRTPHICKKPAVSNAALAAQKWVYVRSPVTAPPAHLRRDTSNSTRGEWAYYARLADKPVQTPQHDHHVATYGLQGLCRR